VIDHEDGTITCNVRYWPRERLVSLSAVGLGDCFRVQGME